MNENMTEFLSLTSGSSGNCSFISDGKTNILIDCGLSGKRLAELLSQIDITPNMIDALVITHEHIDHVKGAGVIARRYGIPIYATPETHSAMTLGSIDDNLIHTISPDKAFEIGTIGIRPFSIPHDAAAPVGYTFFCNEKKYSVATDIGKMNNYIFSAIKGSEKIILESNHDIQMLQSGAYPFPLKQRILSNLGHLSNEAAAATALALAKSGTTGIMLGHLSLENNLPELALLEAFNLLKSNGINPDKDVSLTVASRNSITKFRSI